MTTYHKTIFIIFFVATITYPVYCQPADTTLSQPITGNHVIEATNSITFAAGFSYDAQSSSQLIATIIPTIGNTDYTFTEPQESGPLQVNTGYPVGSIYGSLSVGSTGAANYIIPLDIPPGRNGMKPSLSIVYNSRSSDGYLGLGWSLAGLSSITRVPTDIYHEDYIDVVDFDSNDKFALDGQRLISIGGDQYRTEDESFSKITLVGPSSDPTYFKVETKGGLELYYGNTSDSRVEAQGTYNSYAWNLNQVKDKNGNYYNITYSENNTTGEIRPASINYSCYQSTTGDYTIEFGYENRSDSIKTYINGSQVLISKLMNLITIKYGTTTVGKLQLNYTNSRLCEFIKYGKNNTRLNSTFITWGNTNTGLSESNQPKIGSSTKICQGDFNGDGRMDLVKIRADTCFLFLADQSGQLHLRSYKVMPANFQTSRIYPGDYNGDGLDDLLVFRLISSNYYLSFLISNGNTFTTINHTTAIGTSTDFYITGDFNGNGKSDLLKQTSDTFYCCFYEFSFPGGGGVTPQIIGQSDLLYGVPIYEFRDINPDINGDGKTELMTFEYGGCDFWGLKENTGDIWLVSSSGLPDETDHTLFGDFNGDGITDIFSFDDYGYWRISISKGNGFIILGNYTFSGFLTSSSYNNFFSKDMNGDGKDDIVVVGKGTSSGNPVKIYVGYSTGKDFNLTTYTPASSLQVSSDHNHFGDYNGDGVSDLYYDDNSIARLINTYRGRSQYFVSATKNGLGYSYHINYGPITKDTLYYKGTSTTYPVISYQAPDYVVSSISADNPDFTHSVTEYSYYGAHKNRHGKGFLGYEKITSIDKSLNIKAVDEYEYNTTFYNTSLKRKSLYTLPSGSTSEELISRSTFINADSARGSQMYFSYVDISYDTLYLTGVKVSKNYTFDANGNLKSYREDFDDGSYNITNYLNFSDAGTWLPSKPQTVTNTRKHYQDSQSYSLTSSFTYYSITGQVQTKTVGPLISTYTYDSYGNLTVDALSDGSTTSTNHFTYDSQNMFVWKSYNALDHMTERTYDYITGNVLTEKTPDNVTTSYTYDDFGALTNKSTSALGQNLSVTLGWTTGTRPLGSVYYRQVNTSGAPSTKTYYDAFSRALRNESTGFNGNPIYSSTVYNNKGQVIESSLPWMQGDTALKKVFYYDEYGRMTNEESTAGTISYDYSGKTLEISTSAGQTSSKTSDSQGNIVSASDDAGNITYSYRSVGKPGTITSVSSSWSMQYDNLGRQTSLNDPDAGVITYSYNKFNELTKQTDARGKTDSLAYDILGRISAEVRSEGTKVYKYDPSGHPGLLDSVSYSGGSVKYSYDNASRLTSRRIRIDGTNYITGYGYDTCSRLQTLTYPTGFAIKNVYNNSGYRSEVRRNDNNALIWQGQNINEFGQFTQYNYGNNLTTTKTYDCLGMLKNITTGSVQDMDYSHDYETGNLISRKDNLCNLTEIFTYDVLNRLIGVSGPSPMTMSYASNGNILSKTHIGDYSYESSKPHAVTSVTNPDNLISTTEQRVTYTSFNKVDSVIQSNLVYTLTYGHEDQRTISKIYNNGNLEKTVYYIGDYEKEVKPGNNIRQLHYISGGDGLAAIFVRNNGQDTLYYIHTDHLGSINVITNQSGAVVKNYSFDTWGRRRNPTDWTYNNVPSTFLFSKGYTGHEHLDQFALINMNGRVYDPLLGRVLSPDKSVQIPDFTQSYNKYTYCLNNPMHYSDPTGFNASDDDDDPTAEVQYIHDMIYGPQSRVDLMLRELFGAMYEDVYHGGYDYVILISGLNRTNGGRGNGKGEGNNSIYPLSENDASNSTIVGSSPLNSNITQFGCSRSCGVNSYKMCSSLKEAENYLKENASCDKEKYFFGLSNNSVLVGPWFDATRTST